MMGLHFKPLPFRGGAVRLGSAQQALVAAGWGLTPSATLRGRMGPTPNPSPEGEGSLR